MAERLSDAELAELIENPVTDMEQRLARELQEARAGLNRAIRWIEHSGLAPEGFADELRALLPEEPTDG